MRPVRGQEG
ncbi:hypothetical protein RDI58_027413 [Solanum bulbocastanum]|uniref:Uncharacterized protein n=1 Tax=Solanum bulbocastanum TaxID=147425 RepID=A0AAN8Y2C2_SOLBU